MSNVCNAIKDDDIKKKLKSIIDIALATKKEHGIEFCLNKKNKVTLSNICVGKHCEITKESESKLVCPPKTKYIGFFHTHENHPDLLSQHLSNNDIKHAFERNIETTCIGITDTNKTIKCYDYPFGINKKEAENYSKNVEMENLKHAEYRKSYFNDTMKVQNEKRDDYLKTLNKLLESRKEIEKCYTHFIKESCKF